MQTSTIAGTVDGDTPVVRCAYINDADANYVAEAATINESDPMPFLDVFTEDAVWDVGGFGVYKGKEAIRDQALAILPQQIKFTYHFFSQPIIEIDGDTAKAKWYLWALYTMADGNDMVLAGTEDEEYRRVDGQWLISSVKLGVGCFAPLQQGWGPQVTGQQG